MAPNAEYALDAEAAEYELPSGRRCTCDGGPLHARDCPMYVQECTCAPSQGTEAWLCDVHERTWVRRTQIAQRDEPPTEAGGPSRSESKPDHLATADDSRELSDEGPRPNRYPHGSLEWMLEAFAEVTDGSISDPARAAMRTAAGELARLRADDPPDLVPVRPFDRESRSIYCVACKHHRPSEGSDVVKTSNLSGRGHRCAECSEREQVEVRAFNLRNAAQNDGSGAR